MQESGSMVPIMLLHVFNLLGRAFHNMPLLVSSNWAAVFMAVGIFIVSQLLFLLTRGWGEMKRLWKESVAIGFAAVLVGWLGLYAWSIVVTTYDDHHDMAGRWGAVVNEKDALKAGLKQRDDYIKRLENAHCPPAQRCGQKTALDDAAQPAQARLAIRTRLAELMERNENIKANCLADPPIQNYSCYKETVRWGEDTVTYISQNMEPSYKARFNSASGVSLSWIGARGSQEVNNSMNYLTWKIKVLDDFIKEQQ
jgi:hypothetical protein